jgi:hypothetical protein
MELMSVLESHRIWLQHLGGIQLKTYWVQLTLIYAATFGSRKHYPTQNVLAALDFDLKFTFILAGWEGSAHDALILADAIERDDGLRVPPGNRIIR